MSEVEDPFALEPGEPASLRRVEVWDAEWPFEDAIREVCDAYVLGELDMSQRPYLTPARISDEVLWRYPHFNNGERFDKLVTLRLVTWMRDGFCIINDDPVFFFVAYTEEAASVGREQLARNRMREDHERRRRRRADGASDDAASGVDFASATGSDEPELLGGVSGRSPQPSTD